MATAIIINPISGGVRPDVARRRVEMASAMLDEQGDAVDVFLTEHKGHARELASLALQRGARLVLAWGGDGTINEVASALAFQEVPLGIVPAGSGNGLARELGVSLKPEQAIAQALRATPRVMDVGEIGGRLFVNIAGIGFDAYVATRFDRLGAGQRGLAGYVRIGVGAIRSYVPERYVITIGRDRIETRALIVTIANSPQFGNGARIAPAARVDDGRLDLVVVEERSRLMSVLQLPRLFTGHADRIPGCSIRQIEQARVECEQPMTFHVDGEPVVGGRTLEVRVHPQALRVAVT